MIDARVASPTAAARRARRAAGAASRDLILDHAERLFAAQGVEGASLRAVNAASGFGPAAVNYHFGTKQNLLREVVARRSASVDAGQLRLLDEAERAPSPDTEQLVAVIACPLFDLIDTQPVRGLDWIRLVTQLAQTNDPLVTRRGRADLLEERLLALVARRHPAHDLAFLEPRWRLSILALMGLISASGGEFSPEMSIRFAARGFDGLIDSGA